MTTRSSSPERGKGSGYTCPMHPEVIEQRPGSCPICGMALEAVTPSAEEEPSPELEDMSRRLWVSLGLTLPVFLIAMSEMLPGRPLEGLASGRAAWLQLVLSTPVVLWGGWPFFLRGWASVRTRNLNMFTLIALGTGAAYLYSSLATVAPGIFPASFRLESGEVAVYFEAAAVIVTLVLVGQVLELRARSQTGAAIRALLGLAPPSARRIPGDGPPHRHHGGPARAQDAHRHLRPREDPAEDRCTVHPDHGRSRGR